MMQNIRQLMCVYRSPFLLNDICGDSRHDYLAVKQRMHHVLFSREFWFLLLHLNGHARAYPRPVQ